MLENKEKRCQIFIAAKLITAAKLHSIADRVLGSVFPQLLPFPYKFLQFPIIFLLNSPCGSAEAQNARLEWVYIRAVH